MNKKYIAIGAGLSLLLSGISAAAVSRVPATVMPSGRTVTIPENAVEVAPGVFSLGEAVDPASGELVEGFAIVHYKKDFARGGAAKPPKGGGTTCYGYVASGAKWKIVEPWAMNTTNTQGLDSTTVFNIMAGGISKWEDAADGSVGSGIGVDILGAGSITSSANAVALDEVNRVFFGSISNAGAIAVTYIWGTFGGPPQGRKLVEWDMVFDEVDFDWAIDGNLLDMDLDNIATHELGHAVGLGDLYTSSCAQETMYGYASEGETQKRT